MFRLSPVLLAAALAVGACTTAPPSGPGLAATAGKDKSVAEFRQDDADCRQVAAARIAAEAPPQPTDVAGSPQQRYDASYAQCMRAKGNSVARGYGAYPVVATGMLPSVGMGVGGHRGGAH